MLNNALCKGQKEDILRITSGWARCSTSVFTYVEYYIGRFPVTVRATYDNTSPRKLANTLMRSSNLCIVLYMKSTLFTQCLLKMSLCVNKDPPVVPCSSIWVRHTGADKGNFRSANLNVHHKLQFSKLVALWKETLCFFSLYLSSSVSYSCFFC